MPEHSVGSRHSLNVLHSLFHRSHHARYMLLVLVLLVSFSFFFVPLFAVVVYVAVVAAPASTTTTAKAWVETIKATTTTTTVVVIGARKWDVRNSFFNLCSQDLHFELDSFSEVFDHRVVIVVVGSQCYSRRPLVNFLAVQWW